MYECRIGEELIRLRTAKGVTQDEVAQALSVSNKTISKWENGASLPDLPMLAALSEYFGVAADVLLGRSRENAGSTGDTIRALFAGLDAKEAILKLFDAESALIPAIFGSMCDDTRETEPVCPASNPRFSRSTVATRDLFRFTASSEDVNLSATLLRNKNDFAWLKDPEKQQKTAALFRFLAEEDTLTLLYFLHSAACPDTFTADYIAANTALPEERVTAILKQFCELEGCSSFPAHLAEGDVVVYECFGDGVILFMLSLAYERMCGRRAYQYCFNSSSKMIGGN